MAPTLFQSYDVPPPGFDPRSASAAELRRYGLPRRPDPDIEPEFHAHWHHAVARTRTIVRAELGHSPALDRFSAARHRTRTAGGGPGIKFSTSSWAGAVVELADINVSPPATAISARWVVPTVDTIEFPDIDLQVAFWVGIDSGLETGGGLLQAGIMATVTESSVGYSAWGEWYPADPVYVGNFPVAPGDTVAFAVCNTTRVSGTLHGAVSLLNERTGIATTFGMDPPGGVTSEPGTQVEWIVEAVGLAAEVELPDFGSVVFMDCAAGAEQQSFGVSGASTTEIVGGYGGFDPHPLTQTEVIGSEEVAVIWLG
jgi:hypothetical protein